MGYDKAQKVVPCPAPSQSTGSGGGFNLWTFLTSGVVAATIVGNIVNNVNNNNNNNNNNNQDSQNNNNQNFNNDDNMNMNMNMGKGFRNPTKTSSNNLITVLCHLLTLHFTKQSSECTRRVLCEANNLKNQSELPLVLQKTVSIA